MLLLLAGCFISDDAAFDRYDLDGDGHLSPLFGGDDCGEGDQTVHPGLVEICDGLDNDCDGLVDNEPPDAPQWYRDDDGDGFGGRRTMRACDLPDGFAAVGGDCDDKDRNRSPEAVETCDGIDNDCNGEADDGLPLGNWFLDADGDGFGGATEENSCGGSGRVASGGDCDDTDETISPAASESWYDGVDQDCDGWNDYDADKDTFVALDFEIEAGGTAPGIADCDDDEPSTFPGADDTWYDGVDSDCANNDDYDQDGDTFASSGHGGTDCNDVSASVFPGAQEVWYDGIDSDCSQTSDYDQDKDGHDSDEHGGQDCDDEDEFIYPLATELWYDGVDQDCDGWSDFDQDRDGDEVPGDCDDTLSTIGPSALETWYDGLDQNCDGQNDFDQDGDGYVRLGDEAEAGGTASDVGDCADSDDEVFPGNPEVFDGKDNDCSGNDEFFDSDGDGLIDGDEVMEGTDIFDRDSDDGGASDFREVFNGTDPLVSGDDGPFAQVSAGMAHTCAVQVLDDTVACWGANSSGQSTPPLGGFLSVSAASNEFGEHSCGLRLDLSVECWGRNDLGQANPPAGTFVEVQASGRSSCARTQAGVLTCWGGPALDNPPSGNFDQFDLGGAHGCALAGGQVTCWGDDSFGQATPPPGDFVALASGLFHSCGIRTDETVACWGSDILGQATPHANPAAAVTAGGDFSCSLDMNGDADCWGNSSLGQLDAPTLTYEQIDGGLAHACGVGGTTIVCWGENGSGQTSVP